MSDTAPPAPSAHRAASTAPSPSPSGRGGSAVVEGVRRLVTAVIRRLTTGDGTFDRPPLSDVLLAGGLAALAATAYAAAPEGTLPRSMVPDWVGWLLLVVIHVPLVWRRVAPPMAIAVTGSATGVYYLLGFVSGATVLAVLVALYSVTAYGSRQDGIVATTVSAVVVTASLVTMAAQGLRLSPLGVVINYGVFLTVWALGERTRARRDVVAQLTLRAEEAERSRELSSELAVAEERARIARELHDLVAHTVSVMVVQAGGGRRAALRDPASATAALASVESTGRAALEELRRMVGVLRDQDQLAGDLRPQPDLAALDELVARVRAAGLPVTLRRTGTPGPIDPGIEVSAYRIVQEGLTNVLKHAGTVRLVLVLLHHADDRLEVTVRDDGRGAGLDADARGAGLVGMRERVALYGGRMSAGPRIGGGFEVYALLPTTARPHRGGAR